MFKGDRGAGDFAKGIAGVYKEQGLKGLTVPAKKMKKAKKR